MSAGYEGHDDFLPYLLNRATAMLNVDFQVVLAGAGLGIGEWRVLAFLQRTDGLPVGRLAAATGTDQATLSRMLMRMQKRGLVQRASAAADSRVTQAWLLPPGRALFDAVLPQALVLRDRAVAGIAAGDLAAARRVLRRMLANLEPPAAP